MYTLVPVIDQDNCRLIYDAVHI